MSSLSVGLLVFPHMTQLDATGPYEVFARLPGVAVHLMARTRAPVVTEWGLTLLPTCALEEAPALDLMCVPGGAGIRALIEDDSVLDFLAARCEQARYVTSVCTGALVLGAAGLLRGYRATTHWLSLDLLPLVGAEPVEARVVVDRNRITGGGVTAGIDFALTVAAEIASEAVAQEIQLLMEYAPAPPFASGSPGSAPPDLVAMLHARRSPLQLERRRLLEAALSRRKRLT
jgi:cyclohexyl-isocyanide hydratase